MRMYSMKAPSTARVRFGAEAAAAVQQFPEVQALADVIQEQNGRLQAAFREVVAAEDAMVGKRVEVRLSGWTLDQSIRLFHNGAVGVDGGKPGKVCEALFPTGLATEVTPAGESQVRATDKLMTRARSCKLAAAEKLLAEKLPSVQAALDRYRAALAARTEGIQALYAARAAEDAAQLDHAMAMDKVMSAIRLAYPRDRALWDVIIPPESGKKRSEGGPEDEGAKSE